MDYSWLQYISGQNIEKIINTIAQFSTRPGGGRIAYGFSQIEDNLFKYVKAYIYQLNKGYTVLNRNLDFYEDAIGNLYIVLDSDKDYCVACGSHVDSVTDGGNYDGVFGVAAGLEMFRVLFEHNIQGEHGFCLIVFRSEESSATGVACLGSGVATGQIDAQKLENVTYGKDPKVSFRKFVEGRGYDWGKILKLSQDRFVMLDRYKCFIELHIEQGTVLEKAGEKVGVVEKGIGGAVRKILRRKLSLEDYVLAEGERIYTLKIKGRRDHSGGTPMNGLRGENYRDDALVKSVDDVILQIVEKLDAKIVGWRTPDAVFSAVPGLVELDIVLSDEAKERLIKNVRADMEFVTDGDQREVKIWRTDDLVAVGKVVDGVRDLGERYAQETNGLITATVGGVDHSNGNLEMKFDLRFLDVKRADQLLGELAKQWGDFGFEMEDVSRAEPSFFDQKVVDSLVSMHQEFFDEKAFMLPSMPGHDARNMIKAGVPTGMVFVPCRDGVSHSVDEYAKPEAMEAGARLMAGVLWKLAQSS